MSDAILVINAGSSSIKFKLFRLVGEDLDLAIGGKLDGIGVRPRLTAREQGKVLIDHAFGTEEVPDTHAAQVAIGNWLAQTVEANIVAVGHRVVHGGLDYSKPVLVDDAVLDKLASFIPLAPLHQLGNLDPIREIRKRSPDLPQVACFDTAFHRGHPEFADRFPLPRFLYDEGVRRYGFHGLSYEYVSGALKTLAPELADKRLVVAHLGSGASLCAIEGGRSIESTMGFTALDGIPMGTRSGSLDPGVVLHLIEEKGMSPAEVGHMLYRDSGLAGLSGISNDVRELLASPAPEAAFAIDFFCRRVAQSIASLAVSLGGVDAIVFTAGIGENAPAIRQKVIAGLAWAGLGLDPNANDDNALHIEAPGSRIAILVVPTDEEKMIARHTMRLVRPPT
ncbi:acetate/propionate family kinase [Rhizobiaceae bacterium n13]|uniref:Acetate kinase n=1 Tax=Ferirhizobium litorale TaxID=2927786 RepID=A0AAE3QGK2_9HYPH|nr:acetate/propionate family kinase [Fererhizobium litorale]MDI7861985.1 acetate/propionate family kinase [Fererhizobium litorale]MDI7922743.1 acetate/propionate family kinase [Fererhizobium litorale]